MVFARRPTLVTVVRGNPAVLVLAVVVLAVCPFRSQAHPWGMTEADAWVSEDGTLRIDVDQDIERDLDDTPAGLPRISDSERVRRESDMVRRLGDAFVVRFDGVPAPIVVEFPQAPRRSPAPGEPPVETSIRLSCPRPPGARTWTFQAPGPYGAFVLKVRSPDGAAAGDLLATVPVAAGEESPPVPLEGMAAGWGVTAWRYASLGFVHIVPHGVDHILFVLGLFLLGTRIGPLLWQVSAFTAAHTLTLGLASCGAVSLPARWVEPLIAISIAYVGVENLLVARLRPARVAVVFAFGLLHGLGFAGALGDLGLPRRHFATALVSFNAGVEAGQCAVILAALAAVGWWRSHPAYRRRVVVPGSLAIAATGTWWAATRVLGAG